MGKARSWLDKAYQISWLPTLISGLGAISYMGQIVWYAHTRDSFLDEGLYLLKGYWFAVGKYRPFQTFGPWTNKMPLSFLIPGTVQAWFGPGLRVGRYYAIAVAIIFLLGVWVIARRLGGAWGAAGAVTIVALNPAPLRVYSLAISEGLIAAMLVWTLVLVLGEERPLWQLLAGSFLAGMIPVTRINMIPVLPFTLGYIFWQQGIKKGLWCTFTSMVPFVGFHLVYWQGMMNLWAELIPESISPLLDRWRLIFPETVRVHNPVRSFRERYMSFFEGLRYHFPALLGSMSAMLLWPEKWDKQSRFRIATYLFSLFGVLLLIHGYGSLAKDFNVFAFSVYLSFFDVLGILIVVATITQWKRRLAHRKSILVYSMVVGISVGVIFAYAGTNTFVGKQVGVLLQKHAFQWADGKLTIAPWRWWEVLRKYLGWSYRTSNMALSIAGLFTLEGLVVGGVMWYSSRRAPVISSGETASRLLITFLGLGILLSPTEILGGEMSTFRCQPGVIEQHEEAAERISTHLTDGDTIYWIGSNTQAVLLELERGMDLSFFPQQMNAQYSFRIGGEGRDLAKHGFWNSEIGRRWLQKTDVVILEQEALVGWFAPFTSDIEHTFTEKVGAITQLGCFGNKSLEIYRRGP